MSRISKTVLIMLAAVGVLAFFSPFGASQTFGEATSTGKPAPTSQPVTVTNTPLPVTVSNATNAPVPVLAIGANRHTFTVTIASPYQGPTMIVGLPADAVLESIATSLRGQSGTINIHTPTSSPPPGVTVTPDGGPMETSVTSGANMYWSIHSSDSVNLFLPPTKVEVPVGTQFTIQVWTNISAGVEGGITFVVRYVQ